MPFCPSEDLQHVGWVLLATRWRWQKLSGLLFSVCAEAGGKKLRSTVQRSTETGLAVEMRNWMTRQASRESTDGSMNSYSSEGKWVRPATSWCLSMPCRDHLLSLSLCAFPEANSHFRERHFHFHWLICCEENFCSPTTEIMAHIWLFMSREISLGIKCFALIARR